jgi:ribosomal protein S13
VSLKYFKITRFSAVVSSRSINHIRGVPYRGRKTRTARKRRIGGHESRLCCTAEEDRGNHNPPSNAAEWHN